MKEALKHCPPDGQEWHQAHVAVRAVIASTCGTGIPLDRAAEAAFGAVVMALAEVVGEHDAIEKVHGWLAEYEEMVGEGTFGPVFRDQPTE